MARNKKVEEFKVEDFYFLKVKAMWRYFWSEHPAFWCICAYLFVEYFRPQSIFPAIDFLPWAQLFLLLSIALSFLDKRSRFTFKSVHIWVLLLSAQIGIAILFASYPSWSTDSDALLAFYQWPVIIFLINYIVNSRERFYIFFMVFFLCSLKIAIGTARSFAFRGFGFTAWGLRGPPGYFTNSGELAIQMVVFFCAALALTILLWKSVNRTEKMILATSVIAPALTVIGASSRGSQIALLLCLFLFFLKQLWRPKIIIAVAIILSTGFHFLPEEQKERFSNMGEDNTSIQRLMYWEHGIEMIMDYPITGVGFFNFIPYYNDHYPEDLLFRNRAGELSAQLPHNIFVQIGTDAGIPALFYYLLIAFSIYRLKSIPYESDRLIQKGLWIGMVGFLVAGQFVSVVYYPYLWIGVALMVSNFTSSNAVRRQ